MNDIQETSAEFWKRWMLADDSALFLDGMKQEHIVTVYYGSDDPPLPITHVHLNYPMKDADDETE